eukprot:1731776-Pyramimonas_sp.AAC.1
MPTDYLSLSNTNRDIFDFAVKAGAPDVQLDSLEKKMATVDSVCQSPMEHHMKCAAMVAALCSRVQIPQSMGIWSPTSPP